MLTKTMGQSAVVLALAAAFGGCIRPLGVDEASAATLLSDCAVTRPEGVAAWGTPVTIPFDGGAAWVFDALELAGGRALPGAAVLVGDPGAACAAGPTLLRDDGGTPRALLEPSPAERAADEARGDGRHLALVPRAAFVASGRGHLFYDHVLRGPAGDVEALGTGLCLLDGPGSTCARMTGANGSPVLWPGDVLPVRSAYVDGDAAVLLLCRAPAALRQSCTWARVPVAGAGDPTAYRNWTAFTGWSADPAAATEVLADLASPSAGPNAYLGGVAVILVNPFDARVSYRAAGGPTESLGPRRPLFRGVPPPEDAVLLSGEEQPTLREEGGRLLRIAYATQRDGRVELRLATCRLERGAE